MPDARITKFLDDLRLADLERYALVRDLRKLILALDPSISEEMKYGGVLFSVHEAFCGVFAYTKHVSLEFGAGTSLPDEFGVLEGKGKLRRHIKLVSVDDIARKHVPAYLQWALVAERDRG